MPFETQPTVPDSDPSSPPPSDGCGRSGRGVWLRTAVTLVLAVLVAGLTGALLIAVFRPGSEIWLNPNAATAEDPVYGAHLLLATAAVYVPTIGLVLLSWRVWDRRPLADLGLRWDRTFGLQFALGWAGGAVAVALVVAILWATRQVEYTGWNPEVLTAGCFDDSGLFALSILFFIQSFSEEVLMRGYLLSQLRRRLRDRWAVLLTAFLFSLAHGWNPHADWIGAFNIFVVGWVLGVWAVQTGSLALPIGFHFAWNFLLGSVASLPVSGLRLPGLWDTRLASSMEWLSGGAFGPEAGLVSTVALLVVWGLVHRRTQAPPVQPQSTPREAPV